MTYLYRTKMVLTYLLLDFMLLCQGQYGIWNLFRLLSGWPITGTWHVLNQYLLSE